MEGQEIVLLCGQPRTDFLSADPVAFSVVRGGNFCHAACIWSAIALATRIVTLRGHQYTDAQGRYRLETTVPGIYPGRTRHFHVRVQVANQPVLTTQLYFPNESLHERDFLLQPELLMSTDNRSNERQAAFKFVLNAG